MCVHWEYIEVYVRTDTCSRAWVHMRGWGKLYSFGIYCYDNNLRELMSTSHHTTISGRIVEQRLHILSLKSIEMAFFVYEIASLFQDLEIIW